jgi:hypothetical protein
VFGAVVALTLTIGMAPAWAHYVYEKDWVYSSPENACTIGRAEISHGVSGGGYAKADTSAVYSATVPLAGGPLVPCAGYTPQPPGEIGTAWTLYKWNYGGPGWRRCSWIPWQYNKAWTSKWVQAWDFGIYPPCGPGYYGTVSYDSVLSISADGYIRWNGGTVWSGDHLLPA